MDKAKIQELIARYEQHHQEQIECLRKLFDLSSDGKAEPAQQPIEDANRSTTSAFPKARRDDKPYSKKRIQQTEIPEEWAQPWTNELLQQRLEQRQKEPGCDGGLRRVSPHILPDDPAATFITKHALKDLSHFTFERSGHSEHSDGHESVKSAFHVIDWDRHGEITLDTRNPSNSKQASDSLEKTNAQELLFQGRTARKSLNRAIIINEFTPSALSAVLLCEAKDEGHDYATIYAALRRHLSTTHKDRHYNEGHSYSIDRDATTSTVRHIASFTIPYFRMTSSAPRANSAPLAQSGKFDFNSDGQRYIREDKLTITWSGGGFVDAPSLVLVLNPLSDLYEESRPRGSAVSWINNNLFLMRHNWEEIIDLLDEQTTLSSSITFDSSARQSILFEDRNFTNSKRYFWAIQSLRLFAEHIEGTLRTIPNAIVSINLAAGSADERENMTKIKERCLEMFETLRDRIERKRQEIQSLSDGLYAASSVAEGRFTSEQNANIRLLTLVTIAYLPLTLATSIYSINPLPKAAGLVSYIVVTITMCLITYILVFNLHHLRLVVKGIHNFVKDKFDSQTKPDVTHGILQQRKTYQSSKSQIDTFA